MADVANYLLSLTTILIKLGLHCSLVVGVSGDSGVVRRFGSRLDRIAFVSFVLICIPKAQVC